MVEEIGEIYLIFEITKWFDFLIENSLNVTFVILYKLTFPKHFLKLNTL